LLAEALPLIGHPQIRNRGTIGGSLAHADPASELPAVAVALDAQFIVRKASGQRAIGADSFFQTFFTTSLEPDELLTEVRFPGWPAGAGWSYLEVSRRHGDFAMVGVASVLTLDASGAIADTRLAFTGAAPAPLRARDAERQLSGQPATPDVFADAAQAAGRALDPQSDVHASAAYRRHVAAALTRQALAQAAERARGGAA
jgi:carbon-monoxide dehydrogenase medium subunit